MAAKPIGLASTKISVSLAGSKYAVTGALTRASFSSLTALSCCGVHSQGWSLWVSLRSGSVLVA